MSNVEVHRVGQHSFVASNDRGAEVRVGRKGQEGSFSPIELLLAAAASCAAVTAESLITRRIGEDRDVVARAEHVNSESGHELATVPVDLEYDVSALDEDQRAALETAVRRAVDQLCTVSRTLQKANSTPLTISPSP